MLARKVLYKQQICIRHCLLAFKKIGNPFIVASFGGNCPKFTCAHAIFFDMKVTKCTEDILRILFPVTEASQGHVAAARMGATNIQSEVLPSECCEIGKSLKFFKCFIF